MLRHGYLIVDPVYISHFLMGRALFHNVGHITIDI